MKYLASLQVAEYAYKLEEWKQKDKYKRTVGSSCTDFLKEKHDACAQPNTSSEHRITLLDSKPSNVSLWQNVPRMKDNARRAKYAWRDNSPHDNDLCYQSIVPELIQNNHNNSMATSQHVPLHQYKTDHVKINITLFFSF